MLSDRWCSSTPDVVIKSLFSKYDTNLSNTLEVSEVVTLFTHDLGLNDEETDYYILLLDKDANGCVEFKELSEWLKSDERLKNTNAYSCSRFAIMQKAVGMFRDYDKDGSESLNREEFSKLHADVGGKPEHVDAALQQLDRDGNGKISFYEFMKWLCWVDMGAL